jgi:hypothetical protein
VSFPGRQGEGHRILIRRGDNQTRRQLETMEAELEDVKRKLERIWHFVESTDLDRSDSAERILEYGRRRE